MAVVSPQIQALFLSPKGLPPSCRSGLWDHKNSMKLEMRIDGRLRTLLNQKSFTSNFRKDGAKLQSILGSPNYNTLVGALAETARKYTSENFSESKHGGQYKSGQQILFFEVQKILSVAIGHDVRSWQSADPYQESLACVITRIVASSVGKVLAMNLRSVIRKSKQIVTL